MYNTCVCVCVCGRCMCVCYVCYVYNTCVGMWQVLPCCPIRAMHMCRVHMFICLDGSAHALLLMCCTCPTKHRVCSVCGRCMCICYVCYVYNTCVRVGMWQVLPSFHRTPLLEGSLPSLRRVWAATTPEVRRLRSTAYPNPNPNPNLRHNPNPNP